MKIVGLSFDHMHMGDLLRQAHEHPEAEIVGIADDTPSNGDSVAWAIKTFGITGEKVFTDYIECLEATRPDIAILCPAIARHAELTEIAASYGANVLIEKPFAISLEHADRMIAACEKHGVTLAINWPLAWYRPHATAYRLISEGLIGDVVEVHTYGGNSGPLHHQADKIKVGEEEANRLKNSSWFYKKAAGGGSLIDYIGYGVTLGTWYHGGKAPIEVTSTWDIPAGLEVDEHSITVARYDTGLSKFETRWGTFTDPWTTQPQPKCGYVIVGTLGTIAAYDYDKEIRVQTKDKLEGFDVPIDVLTPPNDGAIKHFVAHLKGEVPLHALLTPEICRTGQRIVDTAIASATQKRTLPLFD